jgi:Ca-activated chloride channel family protein
MIRFAITILASFFFLCSARSQTQNQGATIRVSVDLVSVSSRVTDKQGHDVPGLKAEDFTLFEDGRKQRISFFDTEKEPISISILLDSSSSMNAYDKLGAAQGMLEELIGRSRLEDQVSVLQFTDRVVGFKQISSERRLLTLPPGIVSQSGGTALYDAVASALCHLRGSKSLRQAVVVITDGADQHSRLKLEQLIRLVQSSKAQLFIIGFYSAPEYAIYKQSEKTVNLVSGREIDNPVVVFERLAKESGAEAFFPTNKKSLEQAITEISNILRAQYTLAYYPEGETRNLRRIKIKLNRGGVKIRARQSIAFEGPANEEVHFEGETCEVSAKAHRYPYEARVVTSGSTVNYREDFSDPRTGWPNHVGSRYTPRGYELSYEDTTHKDNQILVNSGPLGNGILAAYGPWWDEYRGSVEVDAGWVKMHAPNNLNHPKTGNAMYASTAGLAFRVDDSGFDAFLLSTNSQLYEAEALSFELVRKTYGSLSETQLLPWTRLAAKGIQQKFTGGIKLGVECLGDRVTLFVEDQEVARVPGTPCKSGYLGLTSFGSGRVSFRNLSVEGTP